MHTSFSQRASRLKSSAIREILKVASSADVISFAGGIPAPETFPIDLLRDASDRILSKDGCQALQYSLTEGYLLLRQWVADKHRTEISNVLITTGSQQALDLLAKALIDPGVRVLVESPTYLGALQAFSLFEPDYVELPCDESGVLIDAISAVEAQQARLAYLMPNFQNPTGRVMSAERRQQFSRLMRESGVLIIEDDPYGELDFYGQSLVNLQSLNPEGVAYLGSFSKVLAPGLRVGYVVAPQGLIGKLTQLKQAADLHTSSLDQRLAYEVLVSGGMGDQIGAIRALYSARCEAMLAALAMHMPAEVQWTCPRGGMFIWLTLPRGCDSQTLLERSIKDSEEVRVAFVPGAPFYAGMPRSDCLRLSFVTVDEERIQRGIARLAANIIKIAGELAH